MFPKGKKKNPQSEEFALNPTKSVGQRARSGETGKFINKRFVEQREKFLDEYVLSGGDTKLAKSAAGYHPATKIEAVPSVAQKVKKADEKLWTRFEDLASQALKIQEDMMNDPKCSYKVKFDITSSLLDRAGYKPAERREVIGSIGVTGDSRAIGEFADRARALLAQKGSMQGINTENLIDAEVVEEATDKTGAQSVE